MKTSKEFFERLQADEAFAKETAEKAKAMTEAGKTDYKEIWIPIAAEYGYELSGDELDEMYEKVTAEITDEELGKISGGLTPSPLILVTAVVVSGGGLTYSLVETLDRASHHAGGNGSKKP